MIKGSIQEEDIIIINVYAPNIGPLHYVRQMLTGMKGEINNITIIVGDFNTPLTPIDRSTKQKISKEPQNLRDTMDQFSSIHFSPSVMSDSLLPHELQHTRAPCLSSTPGVHSDSYPSSQRCYPAISSSVVPFSSCPQSLPASESFPMSQLFTSGSQSIGVQLQHQFFQ